MTETKKDVKMPAKKGGLVKVKNLRKTTLNLSSGQIESGKTGMATAAECSTLHKFIEKV